MLYIIGSLANKRVPKLEHALVEAGFPNVFAGWYGSGPNADKTWAAYEKGRGHTFQQALDQPAAHHIFQFDKTFLDLCSAAILLLPAGKSGHLELGYIIGQGKPGFILMPGEPKRYDLMYRFATGVHKGVGALIEDLRNRRIV